MDVATQAGFSFLYRGDGVASDGGEYSGHLRWRCVADMWGRGWWDRVSAAGGGLGGCGLERG
jgi:hypothetical protein